MSLVRKCVCAFLWDFQETFGPSPDPANPRFGPTDMDFFCERNGQIFCGDFKSPGKEIPYGQMLAYQSLAQRGLMVLIIWGQRNAPEHLMVVGPGGGCRPLPYSRSQLQEWYRQWYAWADSMPRVS